MANKKTKRAVVAVLTAAVFLLGGTFAWQSISQTALNEASDTINPGGRLHDDFDGENKDVYVENFAAENIYARIQLKETFTITMNEGTPAEIVDTPLDGTIHDFTKDTIAEDGTLITADSWFRWKTGGQTVYMPTFNLNKDSLVADINGTYAEDYEDYEVYLEGQPKIGTEIYDADTDQDDEFVSGDNPELDVTYKEVPNMEHVAKKTGTAKLISMEEWLKNIEDGYNPEVDGNYWVYDEDGWAYWSAPIAGGETTGLLLDGIELVQVMDESWYYSIDVTAQFITEDDLGKNDGTGFYDTTQGTEPTANALALLKAIGVDVSTEVADGDADSFQAALAEGEDVRLDGTITSTQPTTAEGVGTDHNILWTEGGILSGGTIETEGGHLGFFINNENNWPVDGDGAAAVTVDGTTFVSKGNDAAVYVQAIDAPATLKNLKVSTERAGIYAEHAGETVTLEECTVVSSSQSPAEFYWLDSAVAVAHGANMVINSGTYTGEYAAYVFSSGGTITINGGHFDGALAADGANSKIVINGGTFTSDPTAYVDLNTHTVTSNGAETNTIWSVTAN